MSKIVITVETYKNIKLTELEKHKLAKIIDDYLYKIYQKKLKLRF